MAQVDEKVKIRCPDCREFLTQLCWIRVDSYTPLDRYKCTQGSRYCKSYLYNTIYNLAQLQALGAEGAGEVKILKYTPVFDGSIVRFKFVTIPKRGWFVENVKPMIDLIKGMVPSPQRTYNPNSYEWEITKEYWTPLLVTLKAMGWSALEVPEAIATGSSIPNVNVPKDYAESFHYENEVVTTKESAESIHAQLVAILGPDFTKREYRAKARELHPDFGGDADKMAELNRLWSLYNAVALDVINA